MKAEINGIQMGFEIIGGTGLPIVLIHGFGLNRSIWKAMAENYLSEHTVILPDLRGHGESQATKGAFAMDILAEDLVALLDFLNYDKAVICGHSMGGYVALAFAEKFPEHLSGLGLITTHAAADSKAKQKDRYQMVEAVREKGTVALAESLAPKLTKEDSVRRQCQQILAGTNPDGIIGALMGMAERPPRMDLLPEIEGPALVVAGKEDQIIEVEIAQQMAGSLTQGRFLLIEDAGHMPMIEAPKALGEGLSWLLSKVKTDAI
jgi:pimeloyl-ACP methyl ester carboxylesterase